MSIFMPLHIYTAIAIAQRKAQRLHNRKKPLKRIDILIEPEIYSKVCEIHQAFLEDSRRCGYHQLSLSEIMRIIVAEAVTHNSENLSL